jgi:mannitol-1-phosphate 5-dehydrogenase
VSSTLHTEFQRGHSLTDISTGFVAEFLYKSGYEVVFVDVMDKIIESLQSKPSYTVTEIGSDGETSFEIKNYRAINSKHEEGKVVEEIATADIVTCAVGPNILKFIAPVIAKGIESRKKDTPLAVIACENAIGATDTLRGFVEEKLSSASKSSLKDKARFANSAVDRIVPIQDDDAGLNVKIEKFYEWCVESKAFAPSNPPPIEGVHFVQDLTPYIERKLFTVNTGHATAAYYGYNRGKKFIHEVLEDSELHDIVQDVLKETAHLIVNKHEITEEEQAEYVEKIVKRISNPVLKDNVERVGRAPLRKLSRKERFIGPAAHLAEIGASYDHLLGSIEMALRFQNVEGDEESVELAKILKENDAETATEKITGLEKSHPLFPKVVEVVKKVQG